MNTYTHLFALLIFLLYSLVDSDSAPLMGKAGEKIYGYGIVNSIFLDQADRLITGTNLGILVWEIGPSSAPQNVFLNRSINGVTVHTLSSDGTLQLSGDQSGNVEIIQMGSRDTLAVLPDHPAPIQSIDITKDNRYVLVAGSDLLTLWDLELLEEEQFIFLETNNPGTVMFSPDGERLITILEVDGEGLGTPVVLDWKTDTILQRFDPIRNLFHLQFSPGTRFIGASGDAQKVFLWDSESFQLLNTFYKPTSLGINFVTSSPPFCFSPDDKYLFFGNYDHTFTQWDIQSGEEIKTFQGHQGFRLFNIITSKNGKYLASNGSDTTLKIWDVQSGELINELNDFNGPVRAVDIAADQSIWVQGFNEGRVFIRDVTTSEILDKITLTPSSSSRTGGNIVTAIDISSDNRFIAIGGGDEAILWNRTEHRLVHRFEKQQLFFTVSNLSLRIWIA